MTTDSLDPVIHAPARLRIAATLAALPDADTLSFTRLQDILDLTPGNLITHLRKLEDAGYSTGSRELAPQPCSVSGGRAYGQAASGIRTPDPVITRVENTRLAPRLAAPRPPGGAWCAGPGSTRSISGRRSGRAHRQGS